MGTRIGYNRGTGFGTAPRFPNKNIDQTPGPGTYNSKPQSTSPKFKFQKHPVLKMSQQLDKDQLVHQYQLTPKVKN